MFLLSAIGLGFLGSLHCIGMCGPISLALSSGSRRKEFWIGRSLYNLGRTSAYVLLGVIFGLFGQSLALAGIQQSLSILLGIVWILALLIFPNWESRLISFPLFKKALISIKTGLSHILQKQSTPLMYNAGFLNGFLPCGLVYIALSGSLASQSLTESMGFMALFGLGTFPAMFAVAYLGDTKT
ncbi:MAG: sulfite exporter TauE/SafE family protein, partial [Bacteroidota bacterium]